MLFLLDCIDQDGRVVSMGKELSRYPIEPTLAKALLCSKVMDCADSMLNIVSILSTENIWLPERDE